MKHCIIAFAMLISKALNALGTSDGVILHLNHASQHEETQQLVLSRSTSWLQSEASSILETSDENTKCIGRKANENCRVQLGTKHIIIIV